MRRLWAAAVACCGLGLGVPDHAHAMRFKLVPLSGTSYAISATGRIVAGDSDRLAALFASVPSNRRIAGLTLDSPGGLVIEGIKLGRGIKKAGLAVSVADGAMCASACFLLFASSPHKMVGRAARIGVHSASEDGEETMTAMAVTTLLARAAAELNVPSQIIGKLVSTGPDQMTWLNEIELLAMGTEFLPAGGAAHPPMSASAAPPNLGFGTPQPDEDAPPPAPAPVGLTTPPPGDLSASQAFRDGQADRKHWEAWFSSMTGDFHAGAEFWAGQRNTPNPGSCFGPGGQSRGAFTSGCQYAKAMLAPADARQRNEPAYKAGWNTL